MSHFAAIVLTGDRDDPEGAAGRLLAPYDEDLACPVRMEACYCVSWEAWKEARAGFRRDHPDWNAQLDGFRKELHGIERQRQEATHGEGGGPVFGTISEIAEIEDEFQPQTQALRDRWMAHLETEEQDVERRKREHPMFGKPDPECEDCEGSGETETTYNVRAKWDWWQVGGRFTGLLASDAYDPMMDAQNFEPCMICNQTGKRYWRKEQTVGELNPLENILAKTDEDGDVKTVTRSTTAEDPLGEERPCNGCDGIGVARKWPTQWARYGGDIAPAVRLLDQLEDKVPYALVTPDGEWHQRGEMGWFGVSSGDRPQDDWKAEVRRLVEANKTATAVVCDLHI